jgi:hypothetical protein
VRDAMSGQPFNADLATSLAELEVVAQNYDEARKTCDTLVAHGFNTGYAQYLRARALFGLKLYEEARSAIDVARALSPADPGIKSFRRQIQEALGEGDPAQAAQPIPPVEIPEEVMKAAENGPGGLDESYGAQYLFDITAVSLRKGVEMKTTERFRVKVFDAAGVGAFSTLVFPFDPLAEEVYVNDLTVRDGAGKQLGRARGSDSFARDDTSSGMVTRRKTLHVPVPGLQPGCVIDGTITTREAAPPPNWPFRSLGMAKTVPVSRSMVLARGDIADARIMATDGVVSRRLDGAVYWTRDHPPVVKYEPYQPELSRFSPAVWLGRPDATWEGEAREYFGRLKPYLKPDDEVKKLAEEKTRGLEGAEAKTVALARMVQSEITYKAVEFGRHSQIPRPAAETWKNRYGDCKDEATLLRNALAAAGIPSSLVLVNSSDWVREDMPSLDQFNHVVVYVPSVGEGRYIDCTDRSGDPARPLYWQAGHFGLIIDEANPRLARLPGAGPGRMRIERRVTLSGEADLRVEEDMEVDDVNADYLRNLFRAVAGDSRRALAQRLFFSEARDMELTRAEFDGLEENGRPFRLRFGYLLRDQMQSVGLRLFGAVPASLERFLFFPGAKEPRRGPFDLKFEQIADVRTVWTAPPPVSISDYDGEPRRFDGEFIRCRVSSSRQGGTVVFSNRIERVAGYFPAEQFDAFRGETQKALKMAEPAIALKKAGA